jgi:hypothetical protein
MIRSKHKFSGKRHFMKDKPVKFGIKLWVLADTITEYTSIFFVYLGKKKLRLLIFQNMLLFSIYFLIFLIMDSFYTTYNLVNDSFKKQVYVIGAVRSNSSSMPTV